MKKGALWVLIIVLIAFIGVGGYLVYQNTASADVMSSKALAGKAWRTYDVFRLELDGSIAKGANARTAKFKILEGSVKNGETVTATINTSVINYVTGNQKKSVTLRSFLKSNALTDGQEFLAYGLAKYSGNILESFNIQRLNMIGGAAAVVSPITDKASSLSVEYTADKNASWLKYPVNYVGSGPKQVTDGTVDIMGSEIWLIEGETEGTEAQFIPADEKASQCIRFSKIVPGRWLAEALQTCYSDYSIKFNGKVWEAREIKTQQVDPSKLTVQFSGEGVKKNGNGEYYVANFKDKPFIVNVDWAYSPLVIGQDGYPDVVAEWVGPEGVKISSKVFGNKKVEITVASDGHKEIEVNIAGVKTTLHVLSL